MTESDPMGGNARAEFQRRAKALSDKLDEIAELQDEVKALKAEAKSDGYDMKAFGQVVKELRRGAEYQADQLQLELILDTYREAAGLPTTLDVAQQRAAAAAEEIPDAGRRRGRSLEDALSDPALDGTSVSIDDGPFHELGSSRRPRGKKETVQ